jgi:hypothetical protein
LCRKPRTSHPIPHMKKSTRVVPLASNRLVVGRNTNDCRGRGSSSFAIRRVGNPFPGQPSRFATFTDKPARNARESSIVRIEKSMWSVPSHRWQDIDATPELGSLLFGHLNLCRNHFTRSLRPSIEKNNDTKFIAEFLVFSARYIIVIFSIIPFNPSPLSPY